MRVKVNGRLVSAEVKGKNGNVYGAILQGEYLSPFYAKGEAASALLLIKAEGGELPEVELVGSVFPDSDFVTKEPNGKLAFGVSAVAIGASAA